MIEPLLTLLLGIVLILAIIAANGYFVAQEFAFMSVDRTKLAARAAEGDAAAARALRVTKRTTFMLSGAQLGITVTGLLVGFVAEPLVGESIGVLLGGTGIDPIVSITIGTVLTLSVAAIVQMIVGELYPKNLAIAAPEKLSRGLARSTLVYLTVFGWLIAFFDRSANLLLRLLRIEPVHDLDVSASAEDLPHIIADSRDSGDLPRELSLMIDRILDFPQRDVEHAMIPRSQVDWVRPTATVAELRALMARAHTRYPVIDDDDAPVGVVHLADVLGLPADAADVPVATLMRPATVIPTLMLLPDALAQLSATRNELACVIDEYGGFAGLLTLEDLAEEVVGEITDEHDLDTGELVIPDGDDEWLMDGDVHLDEVERAIGHELPRGDVETIAGLLIAARGALPAEGDTVTIDLPLDPAELVADDPQHRRIAVDVLEVERHVPTAVRVRLLTLSVDELDREEDAR
ncbi:hemolysin family protein [Microcella frigidaquae]|uniref:CBS domain containing-hemolysin-like protein n=1 Tax=Microcella frigidaquae TaxID=424758 RepID=A0A840XJN7_9MICO|nr:hemolysin family protein [Microcella frigidaquae]MBB5616888.1 CBS domain containing-hemolysin-like protein [Microcella frigidaquae]NHN43673.1 HlyC/CorC family transporter [Microcella frigidaquae]